MTRGGDLPVGVGLTLDSDRKSVAESSRPKSAPSVATVKSSKICDSLGNKTIVQKP